MSYPGGSVKSVVMSHEANIHAAQTSILRELLFQPQAGYAQLQKPTGLTSDHFNFHIKRLVEVGFVQKVKAGTYKLTPRGKEYANKLDTDQNTIERQPKAAVLLAIYRRRGSKTEYLFQERLKHPYYGYWGFPSGKIRWGETVLETAARELAEESGLQARHQFRGLYHEHTFQKETGELLEDKLFFVVKCTDTSGQLVKEFEGGRNCWLTTAQMARQTVFGSYKTELDIARGKKKFVEEIYTYSDQEF